MTKEKAIVKKAKEEKVVAPTIDWDKSKTHSIEEAINLVKQLAKTKFDSSVEVHCRLGIDQRKGDQQVRGAISLPHGTGKTIKVAAFVSADKEQAAKEAGADLAGGEELIEAIKKSEKTDFQVAVAEPAMMKSLAKIAKILGTRGLMPSPKNETVTADPIKAIKELKQGKVSFKNDNTANVHVLIGKVSFDSQKLIDNYNSLINAIKKSKPASSKGTYLKSITICSTMGPGIKVQA